MVQSSISEMFIFTGNFCLYNLLNVCISDFYLSLIKVVAKQQETVISLSFLWNSNFCTHFSKNTKVNYMYFIQEQHSPENL